MTEFQGNEPQAGASVPPEMFGKVTAGAPNKEPAIGNTVQFADRADVVHSAVRRGDGWWVTGKSSPVSWSSILDTAKDPVFVMTPLAALHP